jgi:hypothetical protein
MAQPSIFVWGPARIADLDKEITALRARLQVLEREQEVVAAALAGGGEIPLIFPPKKVTPKTIPATILALMDDYTVGWLPKDLITAANERFSKSLLYKSVRVNLSRLQGQGKVLKQGRLWYAAPSIRTTKRSRIS